MIEGSSPAVEAFRAVCERDAGGAEVRRIRSQCGEVDLGGAGHPPRSRNQIQSRRDLTWFSPLPRAGKLPDDATRICLTNLCGRSCGRPRNVAYGTQRAGECARRCMGAQAVWSAAPASGRYLKYPPGVHGCIELAADTTVLLIRAITQYCSDQSLRGLSAPEGTPPAHR
jgi:hypothetical protein